MYNFLCSSASQQSNAFASWKRSFSLSGSEAKVWQIMPRPFCCELSKLSWMKSSEEIRSPQRNYCCQRQLFWCLIMPSSVTQRFKVSEHQNMIWGQWRVRNDVSWRSLRKRGLRFVYIFIYFLLLAQLQPLVFAPGSDFSLGGHSQRMHQPRVRCYKKWHLDMAVHLLQGVHGAKDQCGLARATNYLAESIQTPHFSPNWYWAWGSVAWERSSDGQQAPAGQKDNDGKGMSALLLLAALKTSESCSLVPGFALQM